MRRRGVVAAGGGAASSRAGVGIWTAVGGQLRHLLRSSVVEDLDGAEVNAGTFRQTTAPINFHNIVIMGPRLHDNPRTVPLKGPNPVLV